MKCPECRFDNREGAKFCKECGTKLELTCPECGAFFDPDSKFCDECGNDLRRFKEAPALDYDLPQSYTPNFLADKILTSRSSLEGERKLVTVLFADVANYTSISEKLDPEEVHQIMDACFKILMDEVHKYEGTINQFTGDGIMAIFGAPVSHEDHAQRACHSALSIQQCIGDYGEKVKKDCGTEFRMRIGINSGPVIVGSIGDDLRMDYTAVGDTTNLAARMEQAAHPGTILISTNTHKIARDYFEFKPIGKVKLKGKEQPQQAYELIKAGEVETRIKASVAKGLTKFVGRKNSMAALKEPADLALSGSGQVVCIVGEAGVGKSRLLLEFINQLSPGEVTYLEGRCLQYGGSIIYMPILEILKSYFDIKEEDRQFIVKKKIKEKISPLDEKLTGIIPVIEDLLSLKVEDEAYLALEPKQKREKIFESLRDLLIIESQNKPLVIAVEDLHWIDKTSEEFLDYLIGWLANARMLLILLYRPEYTHQWGSKSYYTKIGLTQLGTPSSSQLVQAILEEGEVAPELKQFILDRAAGNPLFMEEFTHSLLENGSIQKKDRQYELTTRASDIQVPDTIQGIISARMDRLEDNLKRTMQVASVIGREFAFRILQAITGMREEIKSYLFNLQGLEFIYEKSLFPELEYIFKHALTQEVAYNSLLIVRRKEIHEKIGKAIEELYPHRLEEFHEILAYHYSRSENKSKACVYLKLSGDKAWSSFSASEALNLYKEAICLLREETENQDNRHTRLEILRSMAYPIRMLAYPEGSLKLLEEGESLAKDLTDQKARTYFQTNIGIYYLSAGGDPVKGRAYIERGMEGVELTDEVKFIVPATDDLISSHMIEGEFYKVCQIAPKLIALIEKTHTEDELFDRPSNQYSILHGYYGMSLAALGKFEEGERLIEKGLSYARAIDNPISIAQNEMVYGVFCFYKGDVENLLKHWLSSIEYMEKSEFNMFQGPLWAWLGLGHLRSGQPDKALQYAEKGLEIHTRLGMNVWLGTIHSALSEIYLCLGRLKDALNHAELAVDLALKNNEKYFEAESRIGLGRVIAATGRKKTNEAREQMLMGVNMLDELQIKPRYAVGLMYLGEFYAATGQREPALKNLKKAESMFQEMGMDYWLSEVKEALTAL